jgi:HNH endonuclease
VIVTVGTSEVHIDKKVLKDLGDVSMYVGKNGYVYISGDTLLHRYIMKAKKGDYVDHRNGKPLNCRRYNLRKVTNAENVRRRHVTAKHNTSGFSGVSRTFARGKFGRTYELNKPWFAKITYNRRQIPLGRYETKEDAATAYEVATKYFFGKFAPQNFPVFKRNRTVARQVRERLKSCPL